MKTRSAFPYATRWLLGALVLAAAAVASPAGHAGADEPPIPAGAPLGSWHDNGRGGRYLLQLAQGRPLRAGGRVAGIVTSDTDCQPDSRGLSHCRNAIELADGSRIVVVDTHQMSRNRCLAPGDRLSLSAIDRSWLMGVVNLR